MNDIDLTGKSREEILGGMVEVVLTKPDNFLIVKETLTRMGLAHIEEKRLVQSAHIFHKKGKFYIVHFKEMRAMDGKGTLFTADDINRRNKIIKQLVTWNLIQIANLEISPEVDDSLNTKLYVLPFSEKKKWTLESKYVVGEFKLQAK